MTRIELTNFFNSESAAHKNQTLVFSWISFVYKLPQIVLNCAIKWNFLHNLQSFLEQFEHFLLFVLSRCLSNISRLQRVKKKYTQEKWKMKRHLDNKRKWTDVWRFLNGRLKRDRVSCTRAFEKKTWRFLFLTFIGAFVQTMERFYGLKSIDICSMKFATLKKRTIMQAYRQERVVREQLKK